MGKESKEIPPHVLRLQIEYERDRLIEVVITAIAADLNEGGNGTRSKMALDDLKDKSSQKEKTARDAAEQALTELHVFFAEINSSLNDVMAALAHKQPVDSKVVARIQASADAWARLGRIGN